MCLIYECALNNTVQFFTTGLRTLQVASNATPSPLYYCSHEFYFQYASNPDHKESLYYFYHFSIILYRSMFCLVWDSFWQKSSMNNFYPWSFWQWIPLSFSPSVNVYFILIFKRFFFLCIEFWVERMWIFFLFITSTVSLPCLLIALSLMRSVF